MKNTFQITKEQILYLANREKDNTEYLKLLFPEAFEPELKTGIWYKSTARPKMLYFIEAFKDDEKFFSEKELNGYGFGFEGAWLNTPIYPEKEAFKGLTPATEEEVFERLKEEAIERGFKVGVTVDRSNLKSNNIWLGDRVVVDDNEFTFKDEELYIDGYVIFSNGVWAERCITKEEAEKELGKKII